MDKTKLILHIGSHKTGSTALQNSLYANIDILEKNHGIFYGSFHNVWRMHHNLAFGLFREALEEKLIDYPQNHYYFTEIAEHSKVVIERIKQETMYADNYNKVIISSEGLFGIGNFFAFHSGIDLNEKEQESINENVISSLKNLLEDFDVKVLCYLRRQDLILESFYNQYCKGPNPSDLLPLPSFEQYCNKRPIVMNYHKEISLWANYFGKDNIIVRPYEFKQLPFGVVNDFYSNILELSNEEISKLKSIDASEENSRINRDVLEYKRLLKINGLDVEFLRVSNSIGETKKNQIYLNDAQREEIIEGCKESNEKLVIEYLPHNDNKILFQENVIKDKSLYDGLTLENSIKISSKLISLFKIERKQFGQYISNLKNEISISNEEKNIIIQEKKMLEEEREILRSDNIVIANEKDKIQFNLLSLIEENETLVQTRETLLSEKEWLMKENDSLKDHINLVAQEKINNDNENIVLKNKLEANQKIFEEKEATIKANLYELENELKRIYDTKLWKIIMKLGLGEKNVK